MVSFFWEIDRENWRAGSGGRIFRCARFELGVEPGVRSIESIGLFRNDIASVEYSSAEHTTGHLSMVLDVEIVTSSPIKGTAEVVVPKDAILIDALVSQVICAVAVAGEGAVLHERTGSWKNS